MAMELFLCWLKLNAVDLDVSRTRNLLIWSHCATRSLDGALFQEDVWAVIV